MAVIGTRVAVLALVVSLGGACRSNPTPTREPAPSTRPAATVPGTAPAPMPAPAATTPAATAGPNPCAAICERSRPLDCKRKAACVETCGQMREAGDCSGEMAAVLECMGRQPVGNWECNEDGDAALKDGFCNTQQGRFVACAQKAAAPAKI